MPSSAKKRFVVLYLAPSQVLEDWAKTDPATRQAVEEKMRDDWQCWMRDHAAMLVTTEAGGRTKNVTADGIADFNNDIMLYSVVEGESQELVAAAFEDHPHLSIPRSSIQVMAVRPMGSPP